MKISIGSDHGGNTLRRSLIEALKSLGHTILDRGPDHDDSVDYPDYAKIVAQDIIQNNANFGILICTTGIGVSIAANKIPGARAALVCNKDAAEYSRKHNNANIICFGGKYHTPAEATELTQIFLNTDFEGGRHERRINKINSLEE